MKTNEVGVELIKRNERLRLSPYVCPAGVLTIGYGHTGDVQADHSITEHQADAILAVDLDRFERGVSDLTSVVQLTANEFSALVSFAFNVGLDALRGSLLLHKLIEGRDRREVAAEFDKWVHAGGKVLPGLVRRRAEERSLFLAPVRS